MRCRSPLRHRDLFPYTLEASARTLTTLGSSQDSRYGGCGVSGVGVFPVEGPPSAVRVRPTVGGRCKRRRSISVTIGNGGVKAVSGLLSRPTDACLDRQRWRLVGWEQNRKVAGGAFPQSCLHRQRCKEACVERRAGPRVYLARCVSLGSRLLVPDTAEFRGMGGPSSGSGEGRLMKSRNRRRRARAAGRGFKTFVQGDARLGAELSVSQGKGGDMALSRVWVGCDSQVGLVRRPGVGFDQPFAVVGTARWPEEECKRAKLATARGMMTVCGAVRSQRS